MESLDLYMALHLSQALFLGVLLLIMSAGDGGE